MTIVSRRTSGRVGIFQNTCYFTSSCSPRDSNTTNTTCAALSRTQRQRGAARRAGLGRRQYWLFRHMDSARIMKIFSAMTSFELKKCSRNWNYFILKAYCPNELILVFQVIQTQSNKPTREEPQVIIMSMKKSLPLSVRVGSRNVGWWLHISAMSTFSGP